jgi:hypothetical protein
MFTMILIDSYHVGFLERYNSLVSLYASFNSGNSFPRFSKRYQYNNMPLIMLKYNILKTTNTDINLLLKKTLGKFKNNVNIFLNHYLS